MRLLHLVHQYPPDYLGGTELYTQTLANIQVKAGHEVAVFCPAPTINGGGDLQAATEQGVRIYRVPVGPRTRTQVFRDTFHEPDLAAALRTVLGVERPDIVHIQHLMGMPLGLVDLLIEAGIPYVLTLHDYWFVCANAQLLTNTDHTICPGPDRLAVNCARCAIARAGKGGLLWLAPALAPVLAYRNRRLRAVIARAQYVIAPTDFVRRTFAALGIPDENLVIVQHGIELPPETALAAFPVSTESHGLPPLRIGYIGSIGWQKGVHVLVEAVRDLPSASVSLKIYGDPSTFPAYTAKLKGLMRDSDISMAGPLPREHLWSALAELDLVVVPSLWYETSSLVLDEAFVAGVPVVASDIGVLAEKVTDGLNGRLFPPGNAAALGQVLREILSEPHLLHRWQNGIPPVQTIGDHVREIEALYQSTLDTV